MHSGAPLRRRQEESLLNKGPLTFKLIPDVKLWIQQRHDEVYFSLTQILSGHGCFRSYLHRFGHEEDPYCPYCGVDKTTEHVRRRSSLPTLSRRQKPFSIIDVVANTLGAKLDEDADCLGNLCGFSAVVIQKLQCLDRTRVEHRA